MSVLQHKQAKHLTKKEKRAAGINKSHTATLKFIRIAPLKARLIAREVQGMNC